MKIYRIYDLFKQIVCTSRDHFLARFRDILAFFCMKSHTNSRSEKKNRTSNFSHFTPQSLFFTYAVHFETFGLFYAIGFRIIFVPLVHFLYNCWKLQHRIEVCAVRVPLK